MIAAENLQSHAAPAWYVTDGQGVIGPIDTDLLVRGIASARIPQGCLVTQPDWTTWRHLHAIRETAVREPSEEARIGNVAEDLVSQARDAGESLLFAMHAAVTATRATFGFVHRHREPFVGLVTSCSHGPGTESSLGHVLPRFDPVVAAAKRGRGVVGRPLGGDLHRAIARRFDGTGKDLAGVAMVPVFDGTRLLATIELGREDHPFRLEDRSILQRIARVVSVR